MKYKMWYGKMKSILLVALIVSAVVQTAVLWLGYMPSLSVLWAEKIEYILPINPELVWVNRGDPFTFAYKIDNSRAEYTRLVEELGQVVERSIEDVDNFQVNELRWEEILGKQGILYEYSIPVYLEEVIGRGDLVSEKTHVDSIFINIVDASGEKVDLYLIDESNGVSYYKEVEGEFTNIVKLYNTLNMSDEIDDITRYQPSTKENIGYYIEGNVFLPLISEMNPMSYDVLKFYHPIQMAGDDGYSLLEGYVNPFFQKPLLKKVEARSDGSYIFTEPMKTVIRYKDNGVMEYNNLEPPSIGSYMTMLEGYNIALNFIEETRAIPSTLKKGLYLANVKRKGVEYTFGFDTTYNGERIHLSDAVKEELGLSSLIEVTVRNNMIINAKWTILEIGPTDERGNLLQNRITTQYTVPINKMYEQLKQIEQTPLIEDVKLIYEVENLTKDIELKWGVMYDNRWYYP